LAFFYESTDDGITWTSKKTTGIPNNIAFIDLISDGSVLYCLSNRNIVLKSVDDGNTWVQITINYAPSPVLGFDFAAVGDLMVFSAVNLGTFISTDGGNNWVLKNPSIIIGSVEAHDNEIYRTTYGMYKLINNEWVKIETGFPNGIGVTASTKSPVSANGKIFVYYADVITQSAKIFGSDNKGLSWYETGTDFPTAITTSLNNFLAATPQYLYCYVYSLFFPTSIGTYRYEIPGTTNVKKNENIPLGFELSQNYPNPFNPSTTISFSIPQVMVRQAHHDNADVIPRLSRDEVHVTLNVYDVLGREVATLVNDNLSAGSYSYNFDARNLTSGIYLYKLHAGKYSEAKKMILMK
jgi:hypothetical protein